MKDPNDELSPLAKQSRAATPWLNAVWQFTGSVFFLVAVGYGVDKWAGTGPWGLTVGGLLGSAVGFYAFIRSANRLMNAEKSAGSPAAEKKSAGSPAAEKKSAGTPAAEMKKKP